MSPTLRLNAKFAKDMKEVKMIQQSMATRLNQHSIPEGFASRSSRPSRSIFLSLLMLLAPAAHAQDLTIKAPPQSKPILITGATIHTVSGETIKDGYILFDGGLIKAVGKGDAPASKNADRVDAKGKHVYPGLIGANTNLGLQELGTVRSADDTRETADIAPAVRAAVSHSERISRPTPLRVCRGSVYIARTLVFTSSALSER